MNNSPTLPAQTRLRKLSLALSLIALFIVTSLTLHSCKPDPTAALVDSLKTTLPKPFTAIEEHKGTITLTLPTQKDSIGVIERAEANIIVVKHAALFQRMLPAIQQMQGAQVRLTYTAEGTADKQDFDYDSQTLGKILHNTDAALKEAEEELQLLRSEDTL